MIARLARVALALALIFASQTALLHPLQHVDQVGGLIHVPGKDKASGPLCDALAALTACLSDAPQAFAVAATVEALPAAYLRVPRLADAPPFYSQGPPALL